MKVSTHVLSTNVQNLVSCYLLLDCCWLAFGSFECRYLTVDGVTHPSALNFPTHPQHRRVLNVTPAHVDSKELVSCDSLFPHRLLLLCCCSSSPPSSSRDLHGPPAGNLTKHMKSKAHSKKCMEMGVPELLVEDQDAEDSGTEANYRCVCVCVFDSHIKLLSPGNGKKVSRSLSPELAPPTGQRWSSWLQPKS